MIDDDDDRTTDAADRAIALEDLDVTGSEHVHTLDDGRFVVSTGDGPPRPSSGDSIVAGSAGADAADRRRAESLLASGDYGFDAVLAADGRTARGRTSSDDVAETFGALLLWFARGAGDESSPAETLGLLLAATDASVTLPERAVHDAIVRHDLSPDDSIGDLLAVVREEGGLTLE